MARVRWSGLEMGRRNIAMTVLGRRSTHVAPAVHTGRKFRGDLLADEAKVDDVPEY